MSKKYRTDDGAENIAGFPYWAEHNIVGHNRKTSVDTTGVLNMAESKTKTNSKSKRARLSQKEKKAAQQAAYRKARLQWLVLAAIVVVAVIAVIVLLSVLTEGSLPSQYQNQPIAPTGG